MSADNEIQITVTLAFMENRTFEVSFSRNCGMRESQELEWVLIKVLCVDLVNIASTYYWLCVCWWWAVIRNCMFYGHFVLLMKVLVSYWTSWKLMELRKRIEWLSSNGTQVRVLHGKVNLNKLTKKPCLQTLWADINLFFCMGEFFSLHTLSSDRFMFTELHTEKQFIT